MIGECLVRSSILLLAHFSETLNPPDECPFLGHARLALFSMARGDAIDLNHLAAFPCSVGSLILACTLVTTAGSRWICSFIALLIGASGVARRFTPLQSGPPIAQNPPSKRWVLGCLGRRQFWRVFSERTVSGSGGFHRYQRDATHARACRTHPCQDTELAGSRSTRVFTFAIPIEAGWDWHGEVALSRESFLGA